MTEWTLEWLRRLDEKPIGDRPSVKRQALWSTPVTSEEFRAYNAGVIAVVGLALRSSEAIARKHLENPTRYNTTMGQALRDAAERQADLLSPSYEACRPVGKTLPLTR